VDRDTELAMIAAFVQSPPEDRYKLCPAAFVAPTKQANLSREEIQRRLDRIPAPAMSKGWKRNGAIWIGARPWQR
jgi:hypothetical protein